MTVIMLFRQKLQLALLFFLILIAFASASSPTVAWVQWTTLAALVFFCLLFDMSFTGESAFVFDPDPDNWRRKTGN